VTWDIRVKAGRRHGHLTPD